MSLHTSPDFNWLRVSWGGPDQPQAEHCSYCDSPIGEDDVPLILWNKDGWAARFCDACQTRYWGLRHIPDEADDDQ